MRIAFALALGLTAVPLFSDAELPSLAPAVKSVFPHGVRKGSNAEIELKGENLNGARVLHFAGRGVEAAILSSNRTHVFARVTASADAETGTRDFRLITAQGSYVGVFDVGSLDEVREAEPNDDPRKPQKIALPVVVNGVIGNEDWDHFQFHAAGETLAFEVMATRKARAWMPTSRFWTDKAANSRGTTTTTSTATRELSTASRAKAITWSASDRWRAVPVRTIA